MAFVPLISPVQRIALYETKARYFVIGSNNTQTRFRVLKLDRTDRQLQIFDDGLEYSVGEIRNIMRSLDEGNRTKSGSGTQGLVRIISAFGIVGFVRFTEGYYIVVITQRRRVACIGPHSIYKIEDTKMIYIPNESNRKPSSDEQRYVKLFQSVDLGSNFYFSYSYNLTQTLQYNLSEPTHFPSDLNNVLEELKHIHTDVCKGKDPLYCIKKETEMNNDLLIGLRTEPYYKFVWNSHMVESLKTHASWQWILDIMHGFVSQALINVHGRDLIMTLIGRRSRCYAGTRFLKRGANYNGYAANEVETEQILHDARISSFTESTFCSHVQVRGSVPTHWCQDISKMIPKPPIHVELNDYCYLTAGKHFDQLLQRYGSPVIVLNLVKKRERRKREAVLHHQFVSCINYLNLFVPVRHQLQYISFDMARVNKLKDENVMARLADIANLIVKRTGIFMSKPPSRYVDGRVTSGLKQLGVARINCVDCLDRTNTASFAIGKAALTLQLYYLGILPTTNTVLDFDSDFVRCLEDMYENHGDTLALQYGGSQLVHRIKSYRKTAPWALQGNDIMQTVQRYCSNAFTDSEKQSALNLFLGIFVPEENQPALWELQNDYHLHHIPNHRDIYVNSLTEWCQDSTLSYLPDSILEKQIKVTKLLVLPSANQFVDATYDFYRPFECSLYGELFLLGIISTSRDYRPLTRLDSSPFAFRLKQLAYGIEKETEELSIQESSTQSSDQPSSDSDSDESDDHTSSSAPTVTNGDSNTIYGRSSLTLATVLPSAEKAYGCDIKVPSKRDTVQYRKYAKFSAQTTMCSKMTRDRIVRPLPIAIGQCSQLKFDSSIEVEAPVVPRPSRHHYQRVINHVIQFSREDINVYKQYAKCAAA